VLVNRQCLEPPLNYCIELDPSSSIIASRSDEVVRCNKPTNAPSTVNAPRTSYHAEMCPQIQPVSSQPLSLFGCPFEIVHDCTFILLPSRAMLSDRIVPFLRSPVSRVAIPARCFPRHLNVRGLRTLPSFSLEGKTCVGIQH